MPQSKRYPSSRFAHLSYEELAKLLPLKYNRVIREVDGWLEVEIGENVIIKIDRPDFERIRFLRWNVKKTRNQGLLIANGSLIDGQRGQTTLQRYILESKTGDFVHFKSIDRLDFRRSNLENRGVRLRAIKQKKRTTPTTSIYRGVSLISKSKKWAAQICVNKHCINLGTFDSEIEAALAYNRASRLYLGDDGYQNDILIMPKIKAQCPIGEK